MKLLNVLNFFITLFVLLSSCSNTTSKQEVKTKNSNRPNIIYIYTDQQSETMMSCSGNEYLKTPAMDYIATNGIRFTRAYTTNPVYSPARVSLMTGRFPGYFNDKNGNQARENEGAMKIPEVSENIKNLLLRKRLAYFQIFL